VTAVYFPAGQGEHDDAPNVENVPTGQGVHADAPVISEYDPSGQNLQGDPTRAALY
jgi:hypothetical protein